MNVEIFTLCDAATDSAGKLNILGTFDSITAGQLPVTHQHCAVAVRVRFTNWEDGGHKVRISFVNADGKAVIPALTGMIKISPAKDRLSSCANVVLNINGLKFPEYGDYSLDLAIDGQHQASLPVTVKKPG